MVAFVTTFALALLGSAAIALYSRRRQPGQYLTWGEAMLGAAFVFLLGFWAYGVVPHHWLVLADAELHWSPDRIVVGPAGILEAIPIVITYEVLRDLIVIGIYGLFLTLHVWQIVQWTNRAKPRQAPTPASRYGRPLVRKG